MSLLYNFGLICFKWLVAFAGIFNRKAKKLSAGERRTLKQLRENLNSDGGYIWFHAASLGEFEQGRPLIEAIKRENPQQRILLTFFSPSGYEVRKNYEGVDCVCYLPFDIKSQVVEFLNIVKPSMAIFIKYEFWSNYLNELKRRNIPTYIISAIFRPSQNFFKPTGGFFRRMLRCFTHIYVQDEASKELLAGINITNVSVVGDTRFDRVIDINRNAKALPLIQRFTENRFAWVAGSSWPADEEIFIKYFNERPAHCLIIAPHEIHEEHLQYIESLVQRPTLRLSQANEENIRQAECLIIDSFGLLSSIYRYGNIAYIGGGFGSGIHNILEAAVYGMPVIFGTKYHKFREACEMIKHECAFSIKNYQEFEKLMDSFVSQPQQLQEVSSTAGSFVCDHSGATGHIYKELFC